VQEPVRHDSVALAKSQVTPQPPQSVEVDRDVSQPSAAPPVQSPQPASQPAMEQLPAMHVGVAWFVLQAFPQPPQ
jgi:hypothetical protein